MHSLERTEWVCSLSLFVLLGCRSSYFCCPKRTWRFRKDTPSHKPGLCLTLFYVCVSRWLAFCQIDTSQDHPKIGNLNWENTPIRVSCRQLCGGVFLINNWCGRIQFSVGDATPGQVVLGCIRKQTDQVRVVNQGSMFLHGLCFSSCFMFVLWYLLVTDCKL